MAGMQETDHITLKNGITYLLQDAKARKQLAELRNEMMEKSGIAIQDDEPTDGELVWIDTDDSGTTHIIPEIDDTQESAVDTWSSQKIAEKFAGVLPFGEVTTKIPSGANLNDYVLPGVYAIGTSSIAGTIANIPQQSAGTLRVFSSAGAAITASSTWKYLIQEYIAFTGERYQRYGESGSGAAMTWYAWRFVGPPTTNHAHVPYSSFTSTNGTIWGTESYLDIWWDKQKVIMSGYILLKDVSAGILRVIFQRPAGLPAFSHLICGEAFRTGGTNGSMLAGDFCYISPSGSDEIIAERNMFTGHPAASYARIDINCAIGFF